MTLKYSPSCTGHDERRRHARTVPRPTSLDQPHAGGEDESPVASPDRRRALIELIDTLAHNRQRGRVVGAANAADLKLIIHLSLYSAVIELTRFSRSIGNTQIPLADPRPADIAFSVQPT